MPSHLALLICFVMILILFRLDGKPSVVLSSALWVPTIWALIVGSRMISQWFNLNAGPATVDAYAEGSPLDRAIFLALIVVALLVVRSRGIRLLGVIKSNRWLFVFWLYCGLSIIWSDFPDVSFKRYTKDIGNSLMVLIVLSENAPVEAIATVFKRCAYILIPLSVVMFKYYPNFGRSYGRYEGQLAITGVTNNKNSLGILCALGGIAVFWSLVSLCRNNKVSVVKAKVFVHGMVLALTVWVLLISHSATSLICFGVAIAVIAIIEVKSVRSIILYGFPVILCVLIGYILMSANLLGDVTSAVGRDQSLTGRTEVWQTVMEMVQNPIIGCGYNSFFVGDRLKQLWSIYTWGITEAHNGYLEVYLDLGLIGVILLLGVLASSFRTTLMLIKYDLKACSLKLAILLTAIIYNITESAFRPGLLMYFAFMLVAIQLPRPARRSYGELSRSATAGAYRSEVSLQC